MFLRRSKIIPNVAKGKKPKKKEADATKATPVVSHETDDTNNKETPEVNPDTTNQNKNTNDDNGEGGTEGGVSSESQIPDIVNTQNTPVEPAIPLARTLLSSQDESASSADEANKKSKSVNLPKFRKYKPRITVPPANKVVHKPTTSSSQSQENTQHQNAAETSTNFASSTSSEGKVTSTQLARPELSVSPSKHLVPAAPHCVPISNEMSSSEDEGVIDPYDPNNPQGARGDRERGRHRKNQRIKKTFVGGKPTAMIDYLFYNPKSNPMLHSQSEKVVAESKLEEEAVDEPDKPEDPIAVPAPQLTIGPDGNLIIDEKSLTIERKEAREGREALNRHPVTTSSGFVSTRRKGPQRKQWTNEETLFFYKCLNTVGSDFELISRYFPGCDRRQIKLKFKLEEKRNPLLVDKAFSFKSAFDTTEIDAEFEQVAEKARKDKEEKKNRRSKGHPPAKKSRKTQRKKRGPKGRADYYLEDSSSEGSDDENHSSNSDPDDVSEEDYDSQEGEETKPTKEMLRRIKQEPKQAEQSGCSSRLQRTATTTCSQTASVGLQDNPISEEAPSTEHVAYLEIAQTNIESARTLDPSELRVADVESIINSDSQVLMTANDAEAIQDTANKVTAVSATIKTVHSSVAPQECTKTNVTLPDFLAATPRNQRLITVSVSNPTAHVASSPSLPPSTSTQQATGCIKRIITVPRRPVMSFQPKVVTNSNTNIPNNVTSSTASITNMKISYPNATSSILKNSLTASPNSQLSLNYYGSKQLQKTVINVISVAQNIETVRPPSIPTTPSPQLPFNPVNTHQPQYTTASTTQADGTVINVISKAQNSESILGSSDPTFNAHILKLLNSPSVANKKSVLDKSEVAKSVNPDIGPDIVFDAVPVSNDMLEDTTEIISRPEVNMSPSETSTASEENSSQVDAIHEKNVESISNLDNLQTCLENATVNKVLDCVESSKEAVNMKDFENKDMSLNMCNDSNDLNNSSEKTVSSLSTSGESFKSTNLDTENNSAFGLFADLPETIEKSTKSAENFKSPLNVNHGISYLKTKATVNTASKNMIVVKKLPTPVSSASSTGNSSLSFVKFPVPSIIASKPKPNVTNVSQQEANTPQSLKDIIVLPSASTSTPVAPKPDRVSRRKAPLIIKIPFEEPCFLTPEELSAMDNPDSPAEKRGKKKKDSVKKEKKKSTNSESDKAKKPELTEVLIVSEDDSVVSEAMSVQDEDDADSQDESSDNDSTYLNRLPRPTRSGRVPKKIKVKQIPEENTTRKRGRPKKSISAPSSPNSQEKPAKKRRSSLAAGNKCEDNAPASPNPPSPEPSEADSSFEEPAAGMPPPGSLIVCKSLNPLNNKETYTVFMVPPNTGGTTLEHNPDGTLQRLSVGSSAVAVLPASNSIPTMLPACFAPNSVLSSGQQLSAETLQAIAHNVVNLEAEPDQKFTS